MKIQIDEDSKSSGKAAAAWGASLIRQAIVERDQATIVVATGSSQFEVLHALAARVSGTHLPPSEESRFHDKILDRLPSNKVSFYTASHYYAVQYVQAAIRGLIARERESKNLDNGNRDVGADASQKDL